jgi:hypothetical protein
MPESRHLIKGKPGRNIVGRFAIGQPLPAAGESMRESLMQAEEGVEVVGLRMGPNAEADGMVLSGGAQYYLVGTGSLVHEGRELPPLALLLVQPGDAVPRLRAGANGAEVLIMQLPRSNDQRPGAKLGTLAERGLADYKKPVDMVVAA